jgi:MinD-like ATPase involved in chromosome partitioning or flagellar assembly
VAKIITVHSFRGGTGKSNSAANLAALIAAQGKRVGVMDTDVASPGIHVIFNLDEKRAEKSLNDYLLGRCKIEDTAHNVTPAGAGGKIYLIPASVQPGEITRILREGYDPDKLNEGIQHLIKTLKLDVLLIDTHPGITEETLLSVVISDVFLLILRPDQQDYQGTSVIVEVARKLDVQKILILVNKTPAALDPIELKKKIEDTYKCPVAAILPHSDELMTLASAGIFALKFPDHPVTAIYKTIVDQILA